ncbi:MAG: hypothetical protein ACM3U1_06650 [Chloroflexota bacterium]
MERLNQYLNFFIKVSVMLSLFTLFNACNVDHSTSANDSSKGMITGYVRLFDENFKDISLKDSVTIKLEGTNFTTLTNSNGNWSMVDVPSNEYVATFSKKGFGTYKSYITISKNKAVESTTELYSYPPKYTIDSINCRVEGNAVQVIGFSKPKDSPFELFISNCHIFVSDKPDVSCMPGEYIFETGYESSNFGTIWSSDNGKFSEEINLSHIYSCPEFKPGKQMFIVAYLDCAKTCKYFKDKSNKQIFYSVLSLPSKVISVTLP